MPGHPYTLTNVPQTAARSILAADDQVRAQANRLGVAACGRLTLHGHQWIEATLRIREFTSESGVDVTVFPTVREVSVRRCARCTILDPDTVCDAVEASANGVIDEDVVREARKRADRTE
jgi:hypothetical protein